MSQIEFGKRASTPCLGQLSGVESLSLDQAAIRQLVAHLSQVPEVRQEKVNALQSEIQAGLFQRSDEQVAGAVVSQLLGINSNVQLLRIRASWRRLHSPVLKRLPILDQARTSNKLRRIETRTKMMKKRGQMFVEKSSSPRCEFASQRVKACRGRFGLAGTNLRASPFFPRASYVVSGSRSTQPCSLSMWRFDASSCTWRASMAQRTFSSALCRALKFFTYSAISCCRLVSSVSLREASPISGARVMRRIENCFKSFSVTVPLLVARPSARRRKSRNF